MGSLLLAVVKYIRAFFVPRHKLTLEGAVLRQQLAVFKRKPTSAKAQPRGPTLLDHATATVFGLG
jgi:hypothetical protein